MRYGGFDVVGPNFSIVWHWRIFFDRRQCSLIARVMFMLEIQTNLFFMFGHSFRLKGDKAGTGLYIYFCFSYHLTPWLDREIGFFKMMFMIWLKWDLFQISINLSINFCNSSWNYKTLRWILTSAQFIESDILLFKNYSTKAQSFIYREDLVPISKIKRNDLMTNLTLDCLKEEKIGIFIWNFEEVYSFR